MTQITLNIRGYWLTIRPADRLGKYGLIHWESGMAIACRSAFVDLKNKRGSAEEQRKIIEKFTSVQLPEQLKIT